MKFFLVDDYDASSDIFNTMAADDLVTKEPGHQQPWYWPSYLRIFQLQHYKG